LPREKKNKEPKPRINTIEKTTKKQCKKETERAHNHIFQGGKTTNHLSVTLLKNKIRQLDTMRKKLIRAVAMIAIANMAAHPKTK
jgi:hypothetical protein